MPALLLRCFAVTAPGLEALAAAELSALGIPPISAEPGGVEFEAALPMLYAANLELRTATRVLVRLAEFPARAFHELERKAARVPWGEIVPPGGKAQFRVTSTKSKLYHGRAIAERLGTAVSGKRGAGSGNGLAAGDDTSDEADSGVQLFVVRVHRDIVTISADASGELLHRRGYRLATAKAPLRETLAAAVLLGAGYDGSSALVDPFCGSGTIAIEAALIARRIAPGISRRFAFERWPGFDAAAWTELTARAAARALPAAPAPIVGSDRDAGAIAAAEENAARAGLAADIIFRREAISAAAPPGPVGLLATNPPYGVRVSEEMALRDLYARLGALARERWEGWSIAMLAAGEMPLREMGLPFEIRWESTNGGIRVRLVVAPPRGTGAV